MISVIVCCPVDTTGLPDPENLPAPTIAHTIKTCLACKREVWVGQAQARLARTGGGEIRCYWCVFDMMRGDRYRLAHVIGLAESDAPPRR
jgi:hypothetical protein